MKTGKTAFLALLCLAMGFNACLAKKTPKPGAKPGKTELNATDFKKALAMAGKGEQYASIITAGRPAIYQKDYLMAGLISTETSRMYFKAGINLAYIAYIGSFVPFNSDNEEGVTLVITGLSSLRDCLYNIGVSKDITEEVAQASRAYKEGKQELYLATCNSLNKNIAYWLNENVREEIRDESVWYYTFGVAVACYQIAGMLSERSILDSTADPETLIKTMPSDFPATAKAALGRIARLSKLDGESWQAKDFLDLKDNASAIINTVLGI